MYSLIFGSVGINLFGEGSVDYRITAAVKPGPVPVAEALDFESCCDSPFLKEIFLP